MGQKLNVFWYVLLKISKEEQAEEFSLVEWN